MAIAWAFFTAILSARNSKSSLPKSRKSIKSEDSATSSGRSSKVKAENEGRSLSDIKAESDSDIDSQLDSQALAGLSGTERTFPTLGRNAQPLRYTPSSTTNPSEDAISSLDVQREDPTHDAEDEGEGDDGEEARGRIITPISGIMQDIKDEEDSEDERFRGDSGIGTSMESDNRGSSSGVRRRSSRGGSRGRGTSR